MRQLAKRFDRFGSPRIVLVGDFMLDRYVYGHAERISPEGPVPILKVVRTETRLGGAGSVAGALQALGAKTSCVGLRGCDRPGEQLCALLAETGAGAEHLLAFHDRRTTVKTRYVGLSQHRHQQQVLRVDCEQTDPPAREVLAAVGAAVRKEAGQCKVVALEDYDKGVLGDLNTPEIIADARRAGCAVLVDPARIRNYARYRNATLLTPNRFETELASGIRIVDPASLAEAAGRVLLAAEADAVAVTLDKEGAYLLTRDGQGRRIPTRPRTVYDVTGAGDEVLAMLALAVAEGCTYTEAITLANVAGGLEVQRFGAVAIPREEVLDELRGGAARAS